MNVGVMTLRVSRTELRYPSTDLNRYLELSGQGVGY